MDAVPTITRSFAVWPPSSDPIKRIKELEARNVNTRTLVVFSLCDQRGRLPSIVEISRCEDCGDTVGSNCRKLREKIDFDEFGVFQWNGESYDFRCNVADLIEKNVVKRSVATRMLGDGVVIEYYDTVDEFWKWSVGFVPSQ